MEFEIEWAELADNQLDDIYFFYLEVAGERVADRMLKRIGKRAEILVTHPQVGQREELLRGYSKEFRYLVVGNYKIIYYIDGQQVKIVSVFDCRQDPDKLKQIIKQ